MCLAGQLNQQFPPLGVRRKASLSGLRTDMARASEPRRKASCGLKHGQARPPAARDGRATKKSTAAKYIPRFRGNDAENRSVLKFYFNIFANISQEILKIWQFQRFLWRISGFYRTKRPFLRKNHQWAFFDLKKYKIWFRVMKRTIFDELSILWFCDCFWYKKHRKVFFFMLKVKSRAGESVQQMIRRFKKLCEKEGLIRDMKRMAYYEKPSEKNRRRMRKAQRTINPRP